MLATYISLLAPKNKNVTTTESLRRYRWMFKEKIRKNQKKLESQNI
jgi:hypothetical protein